MTSLWSQLKQETPKLLLMLPISLVGMIAVDQGSVLSVHVLPLLDKLLLLKGLLIAIVIILSLLSWVYFLKLSCKDNIKMSDYDRPSNLAGVSKHKKTGELFCTSCLSDQRLSPVLTTDHYWRCLYKLCLKNYNNPDNPAPAQTGKRPVARFGSRDDRW